MRFFHTILIFLLLNFPLHSQQSKQTSIPSFAPYSPFNTDTLAHFPFNVRKLTGGRYSISSYAGGGMEEGEVNISIFNNVGELENNFRFVENSPFKTIEWGRWYSAVGSSHVFTCDIDFLEGDPMPEEYNAVVFFDDETENYWCKAIDTIAFFDYYRVVALEDGLVTTFHYDNMLHQTGTGGFGLCRMNRQGTTQWNKFYTVADIPAPYNFFDCHGILEDQSGNVLTIWSDDSVNGNTNTFILKVDEFGEPILSQTLTGFTATQIRKIPNSEDYLFSGWIVEEDSFLQTGDYAALVRTDADFNVIWSRQIELEKLRYVDNNISIREDGTILLSYQGFGDLPIVVAILSEDGSEIISQQGYPFRALDLLVLDDNSIVFTTLTDYRPDNTIGQKWIMAKTNPDGTFDDCPIYTACINIEDFEVGKITRQVTTQERDTLPFKNIFMENVALETEPHCAVPPAPEPFFTLPDTICSDAIIIPADLKNHYAHAQEWYFTKDGETVADTIFEKSFEISFEETGLYHIRQKIWFLGCEYEHNDSIYLVRSVDVSLGEDRVLCEPEFIGVSSERPPMTYLWNTGDTTSQIFVDTSGVYSVQTIDEYCVDDIILDTVELTMIDDLVSPPVLTISDTDSTSCRPYEIFVTSPYVDELYLNGVLQENSELTISTDGTQTITTYVNGCPFTVEHYADFISCTPPIYLPNAFSPNFDGYNDFLFPFGKHFELISLDIRDRWGGRIYSEKGEDARWDGANVDTGVYVVIMHYLNLLTGEKETLVRDVSLVR